MFKNSTLKFIIFGVRNAKSRSMAESFFPRPQFVTASWSKTLNFSYLIQFLSDSDSRSGTCRICRRSFVAGDSIGLVT